MNGMPINYIIYESQKKIYIDRKKKRGKIN